MLNYRFTDAVTRRVTAVFTATMRVISERHLAAMVAKGISQFPENGDRLGGTIDIWWIVRILCAK